MADVSFYRGGTPHVNYMWCEHDYAQWSPPFNMPNLALTPPYDAHVDGAYGSGLGYFTLGMPVCPRIMEWQQKAFLAKKVGVDDVIDLLVVPEDHFVTALNFKIVAPDAHMAGATVVPVARTLTATGDGVYEYDELTDIEDALTAQQLPTAIGVDKPVNVFVSLLKVTNGYAKGLYATPGLPPVDASGNGTPSKPIVLGLKVLTKPTDSKYDFPNMVNAWYMSAKVQGFECPTYY